MNISQTLSKMSYLVHRVMDSPKDGRQTDGQPEGQMDTAAIPSHVNMARGKNGHYGVNLHIKLAISSQLNNA